MPLAGLTGLNGLRDVGRVQPGNRVLIIGASGGVGTYVVQIAKIMGAHVTGVCSTANLDLARELGCDEVIDYTAQSALETDQPYDVIYDTIGVLKYLEAREALTPEGVYMTLVPVDDIDFFFPGQTELKPRGGYFLVWSPNGVDLAKLGEWVDQGKLRSVIDNVYSLDDIRDAHDRSRTLHAVGKIVIRIDS